MTGWFCSECGRVGERWVKLTTIDDGKMICKSCWEKWRTVGLSMDVIEK